MPLIVPKGLRATESLRREGAILLEEVPDGVRPLRVILLNLMPKKEATEADFLRVLSQTPLYVQLVFMKISRQTYKNTPIEHMQTFYNDFEALADDYYDGLIVTGAPIEHMPFESVRYWTQLSLIFTWARTHVSSTLYVCWGAQAGLYYHFGVPKYDLPEKMFGVFDQNQLEPECPIFRGFDSHFYMPHSRHTELRRADIEGIAELSIIAESPLSGVSVVKAYEGREFYVTGHLEYAPLTLDGEYKRDVAKNLPIKRPHNYYVDDDPEKGVNVTWRAQARMFYMNWLHEYVNPDLLIKHPTRR